MTRKYRKTWRGKSYTRDPLYKRSVDVDVESGLPADYTSLFAAYRAFEIDAAARNYIPFQDREDAVQEIDLRFFARDGLSWYDPDRERVTANGQVKKIKFGSMYNSWTFQSMLAERDRHYKYVSRYMPVDSDLLPDGVEQDCSEEVAELDAAQRWVNDAVAALLPLNRPDLVAIFKLCVESANRNKTVTRADVVEVTGCSLRSAFKLLKELREVLSSLGMGADTLNG